LTRPVPGTASNVGQLSWCLQLPLPLVETRASESPSYDPTLRLCNMLIIVHSSSEQDRITRRAHRMQAMLVLHCGPPCHTIQIGVCGVESRDKFTLRQPFDERTSHPTRNRRAVTTSLVPLAIGIRPIPLPSRPQTLIATSTRALRAASPRDLSVILRPQWEFRLLHLEITTPPSNSESSDGIN
jgi:hypothetical protein